MGWELCLNYLAAECASLPTWAHLDLLACVTRLHVTSMYGENRGGGSTKPVVIDLAEFALRMDINTPIIVEGTKVSPLTV